MLYFIGLGLNKKGVSLKGLETARNCDKLFLEGYSSVIPELSIEELEKELDNNIRVLDRKEVEQGDVVLKEAKESDIGFLVMGDPMVATTHISLKLEAEDLGIETEILHASSIYSAVAETGLQIYKMGKTATIPMKQDTDVPYETLEENKERGLHTLFLLDLDPKNEEFLTVDEAVDYLMKKEEEKRQGVFDMSTKVIGAARIGAESVIHYGRAGDVKEKDFGAPPYILVVPGDLHFKEEETLKSFEVH